MMASSATYEIPVPLVIAFLSPVFLVFVCCLRRYRKDRALKEEKKHALQRRSNSKEALDAGASQRNSAEGKSVSNDLESPNTSENRHMRARDLWQFGIKKALGKASHIEVSSVSSSPSSHSTQLWKKGIKGVIQKKRESQREVAGHDFMHGRMASTEFEDQEEATKGGDHTLMHGATASLDRDWWKREDSDEEEVVIMKKKPEEDPIANPRPRPTVSVANADIASQRVRALYDNRGALAATLSVQSITHAEARCAAERTLNALGDASPGPAPDSNRLMLPGGCGGVSCGLPGRRGAPPPPPGQPPEFAFTRPEESACRFRFNCSCRKFRGVDPPTSRPPTRESHATDEEGAVPKDLHDIDWQAPCLDCGHARMYHRRTPSAGTSGSGNRIRRPTPFEILEGYDPPWRQGHRGGEVFFYNPTTLEIRNVEEGIERFDEKAAVEALGPRGEKSKTKSENSPKARQSRQSRKSGANTKRSTGNALTAVSAFNRGSLKKDGSKFFSKDSDEPKSPISPAAVPGRRKATLNAMTAMSALKGSNTPSSAAKKELSSPQKPMSPGEKLRQAAKVNVSDAVEQKSP